LARNSVTLFILKTERPGRKLPKVLFSANPIRDVLTNRHHRFHTAVVCKFRDNPVPVISSGIFKGPMNRRLFRNRFTTACFKTTPVITLERNLPESLPDEAIRR